MILLPVGILRSGVRRLVRRTVRVLVIAFAVFLTLLLVHAFASRGMLPYEVWHREPIEIDFTEEDYTDNYTLADWMAMEDRVFGELERYRLDPGEREDVSPFSRYVRGGRQDPSRRKTDWNRTQEIAVENPKGGVLLIHGLSDSPYSLKSQAGIYADEGYHVLVQRMPGHGTVPAGLLDVTWRDWAAAVKVGVRHLAGRIGPDRPLHLVGYSNGGALAVEYTLAAIEDGGMRVPDRVVLFSPAIGITEFAKLARWDEMYGFIPYFEKSRWLGLLPEIDPYKYASFTKNAGSQSWNLAETIREKIEDLESAGRLGELPPMLSFQSAVDDTVIAPTLLTGLYEHLGDNGSELVLFDVNHAAGLDGILTESHQDRLRALLVGEKHEFALTVITNADSTTHDVVAKSWAPGETRETAERLGLSWPRGVYSLAHISLPFPPDDPLYGEVPAKSPDAFLPLGRMALYGERGVIRVPASELLRQHFNPFHSWVVGKIRNAIREDVSRRE